MRQDHGYGPWDSPFIKRGDGPVADPSRKDTKMARASRLAIMLCFHPGNSAVSVPRALCPQFFGLPGQVGFNRLLETQSRKVAERAANRLLPSAMDWTG